MSVYRDVFSQCRMGVFPIQCPSTPFFTNSVECSISVCAEEKEKEIFLFE